jgi:hypothetical protein
MKRKVFMAAALAGAVFTAGTAQQALKNKESRIVPIKLEKELTLGERADGQEALFQSIRSFRVDDKGNFYVLDSRAPKLMKFDRDGKVLFSVGRKGQGPGEFMAPSGIEWGKNGSILITDMGNRRLAYFSADDGELLEEKSTAKWPRFFRIDDDSQGFFYGYQILYEPGKKVGVMSKFNPALDLVKEVFRVEDKLTENEIDLFSPGLFFRVLGNDGLLVAKNIEYALHWYDSNGDLVRTAHNAYRRVPLTAADKEREIRAFLEGGPAPKDQIFVFPDHYPPIQAMITDDQDNVFIRRFQVERAGHHYYEAFNKDGKPLGKFPLGFNLFCVAGDKMYSLETDPNGFDQICRYRFKLMQ